MKRSRLRAVLGLALLAFALLPRAANAEFSIGDNLSSYTGVNAKGYMEPLKNALGSALNSGLYSSGHVARAGFGFRLELRGMLVSFSDDDKTFDAKTEDYFPTQTTAPASTVVGSVDAVTVQDPGTGATFAFPGGLELDRFALAAPQLVVGSVMGTEGILRYFAIDTGDTDIGNITLFGLGVRHSLSQYLPAFPVNLSALLFFQSLEIGDKLIDASAFTLGVQASKRYALFEPYAGLSLDSFKMDVQYDTDVSGQNETLKIEFDRDTNPHLTLGSALHLGFFHLNGELNLADQTGFTFGLGLGL